MVHKDLILKSIEEAIITKCPNSSRARKRGTGGVQTGVSFSDSPFENTEEYSITYPDGTKLTFDPFDGIKNIYIDGVDYDYLGSDRAYTYFQDQDTRLKETEAELKGFQNYNMRGGVMDRYDFETEYDFVKHFVDDFASYFGVELNKKLYAGESLKEYTEEDGAFFGSPVIITDSQSHVDHFVELEKNNRIDKSNIVLQTYTNGFHDIDRLDKLSFTDKGFTSTSCGGDNTELKSTFGSHDDSWTVYTIVKEGSGVTGLFLGNALVDSRTNKFRTYKDWEAEVNLPPKTRYTRDLIDEDRHIIIQHVEKQT